MTSKAKKKAKVVLCSAQTKYNVVKKVSRDMNFKMSDAVNREWDLYWSDVGVFPEQVQKLKPHQRINCQPGTLNLARKNNLARNLSRLQRHFPKEYKFYPETWVLPQDLLDFKCQFDKKKKSKTFIIKPVSGCQGKGIYLTKKFCDVEMEEGCSYVAQKYMGKPYLIDDLKFDLRVYCLVYGSDPLRVFMFKEGIARFATAEYTEPTKNNLDNLYMHLTNYAINKDSDDFIPSTGEDDDYANKRTLSSILAYMEEHEEDFEAEDMLRKIEEICVKTVITAQPALAHSYHTCLPNDLDNSQCFQLLGLDIMIDSKLKPWLLEVNHLSSLATDSPLDKTVKYDLVSDTLRLLNLSVERRNK